MSARSNRNVVYTAIIGHYDSVPCVDPSLVEEGWDFLCFSDLPIEVAPPWQLRRVVRLSDGAAATNRHLKFLGHQILDDYDWALYMDGNLELIRPPSYFLQQAQAQPCVLLEHPNRATVSEEIVACIVSGKIGLSEGIRLARRHRAAGFEPSTPLTANRLFVRSLADPKLNTCFEATYSAYLQGPRRDQLHLNFELWRHRQPHALISRAQARAGFRVHNHAQAQTRRARAMYILRRLVLALPLKLLLAALKPTHTLRTPQ